MVGWIDAVNARIKLEGVKSSGEESIWMILEELKQQYSYKSYSMHNVSFEEGPDTPLRAQVVFEATFVGEEKSGSAGLKTRGVDRSHTFKMKACFNHDGSEYLLGIEGNYGLTFVSVVKGSSTIIAKTVEQGPCLLGTNGDGESVKKALNDAVSRDGTSLDTIAQDLTSKDTQSFLENILKSVERSLSDIKNVGTVEILVHQPYGPGTKLIKRITHHAVTLELEEAKDLVSGLELLLQPDPRSQRSLTNNEFQAVSKATSAITGGHQLRLYQNTEPDSATIYLSTKGPDTDVSKGEILDGERPASERSEQTMDPLQSF